MDKLFIQLIPIYMDNFMLEIVKYFKDWLNSDGY